MMMMTRDERAAHLIERYIRVLADHSRESVAREMVRLILLYGTDIRSGDELVSKLAFNDALTCS